MTKYISYDDANSRIQAEIGTGISINNVNLRAYCDRVNILSTKISGRRMLDFEDFAQKFDQLVRLIQEAETLSIENARIGSLRANCIVSGAMDALREIVQTSSSERSESHKLLIERVISKINENLTTDMQQSARITKITESTLLEFMSDKVIRKAERSRRRNSAGRSRFIDTSTQPQGQPMQQTQPGQQPGAEEQANDTPQ